MTSAKALPEGFIPDDVPEGFIPDEPADAGFAAWMQANGVQESDDYDYRGAFEAGEGKGGNGHFTDRFKRPNHPTFSTGSKYNGEGGAVGGQWVKARGRNRWEFRASEWNLKNRTREELMDYFDRVEPGQTIRFPDGTSYVGGSTVGPAAPLDQEKQVAIQIEEHEAALDSIVTRTIELAQRGDDTKELEAAELARTLRMSPTDIKPSLEQFRATAKAMRENPRRWRRDHPELFDLITRDPDLGPHVVKEVTKWRDVVTPDRLAFKQKHPWLYKLFGMSISDVLNENPGLAPDADELRDSSGNVVARKETEQVRYRDLSHLSDNSLMQLNYAVGETVQRSYREGVVSKLGLKRAYAEIADYDSDASKALRERYAEERASIGLPDYFGDGVAVKAATGIAEAVSGQTDSMVSLGVGLAVGAFTRRPQVGLKIAKIAGAITSFASETGGSYNSLADTLDDSGKVVDHRVAFAAAHVYGMMAAAVEAGAIGIEASTMRGFARRLVTDQTKRGALLDLAAKLAKNAGAEAGEEGLQRALQLTIEWFGKISSAGEVQRANMSGAVGEIADSSIMGGVGGLFGISLLSIAGDAAQALQNVDESRNAAAHIAAIHELAKTKAAQAAPSHVARWLEDQKSKTGRKVSTLYVDPTKLVEAAIKGGARADDVARELMGDSGPQRLQDALDRTGDAPGARATLEVPLAEYLEKWGAKPIAEELTDHMSTFAGGQTLDELKLFQGAVDELASSLEDDSPSDADAMTAEEAAAQGTLEEQLVASGRPAREARLAAIQQTAFARAMSKRYKIPFARFMRPTLLTVQGVGVEQAQAPEVVDRTPPSPPKAKTFKNVDDAFKSLLGAENTDISGVADFNYNKWRNDKKGRTKPAAFADGTFDAVNEHLGLTGANRVSGFREAFDKLFHRSRGNFVERTQEAIRVLKQVPGLEGLRIPDEYVRVAEQQQATNPDIAIDPDTGEQLDMSFDFGANADSVEVLDQSPANEAPQPASLQAITDAYGKMDPEGEGFATYFIDRNTRLMNRRGFEQAFKAMRTHEKIAAFGFEGAKYFNDVHGHGSVDGALRIMADVLHEKFPIFSASKLGGEIFVIMPDDATGTKIAKAMREAMPSGADVTYGGAVKKRKTLQQTIDAARDSLRGIRMVAEKAGAIAPRGELPAQFRGGQGSPADTAKLLAGSKIPRSRSLLGSPDFSQAFAADQNKVATIYQDAIGLLSDDGFAAARKLNPRKFVVSADIRGFKGMNDVFGVETTDGIKAFFSRELYELGAGAFDTANLHGDEYAAQGDNKAALDDFFNRAGDAMRRVILWDVNKDGSISYQLGLHFAHGTAEDEDTADRVELPRAKQAQNVDGTQGKASSVEEFERIVAGYGERLGGQELKRIRAVELVQKRSGDSAGSADAQSPIDRAVDKAVAGLGAGETPNLVVIHNLTADNVQHADELGALPAPSIAVSRVEQPLDGFGEISLLGGPDLIDPKSGVPVFDADVYSPRWPDSEFQVDMKKAMEIINELSPFSSLTKNTGALDAGDLRKEGPADVVNRGAWQEVLGAAYLNARGIEIPPYSAIPKEDTSEWRSLENAHITRFIRDYVRSNEHQGDYTKWAVAKVKPALGDRKIVKGARRLPYTLENILKEMTKKIRAGEQFNYGLGTARSFGAKRFKSIKDIQKARDRIVDEDRFEELRSDQNDIFYELAQKMAKHHPIYKSGKAFGSLDGAANVIGDSYKRGTTMRAALTANGYDGANMPAELVQEVANFATDLLAMPTQYFEAKPQRAVGLNEFKVAVVPSDTDAQVVDTLKRYGLEVRTYEKDEILTARMKARQKAVQAAAEELQILFQGDETKKRGWIAIARKGAQKQFRVFLTKHQDASTFVHESGHFMFETMEDIAKDPKSPEPLRRDWATLRKYVGAKDGEELTRAQKEKLARSWEAYLMEGKAPSAALAEVFYAFSRWLLGIYKSVTKLGVELNDDVRVVFDRMIATDQEIERARGAAGLSTPMASTPQEAGVRPEDFDKYLAARQRIGAGVIARTQEMIAQGQLRAAKAFKTEEFRKLTKRFEKEYDGLPETKVWRYLTLGELVLPDGKIERNLARGRVNRDEVINALGADSNLFRRLRHRFVKSGGESIADLAEMFGFVDGGVEMLKRVASMPEKSEWVKQEAEREMRVLHPEIDGEIANLQEAVQRLQHTDSLGEAELDWQQAKAKTNDQLTLEALQRSAKRQVDERLVGRIDPQNILNRERTFAMQAAEAQLAGRFDEAMALQHRRLLHKYLYKEMLEARDMREAGLELMLDLVDDESRGRMGLAGAEYRDVIDTLLEAIGIVAPRKQEEPRLGLDRLMGRMGLDGNSVVFDPLLIGKIMGQPMKWQELKISEFREVVAALKNIRAAARNVTTLLRDGKRIDKEQLIAELIAKGEARIRRNKEMAPSRSAETMLQKGGRLIDSLNALTLRPETVLEELGWDDLLQPLQDAKYMSSDLMAKTVMPISKLFDNIPKSIRNRLNDTVDGRALFPDHIRRPPPPNKRYHLLMMALNAGNESNLMRLLGGRGITQAQLDNAMSQLTAEELAWVQGVWDQIGSLWPMLRELEERDSGVAPDRIEPKPFTVQTADGKTVAMRGGYFPAAYDGRVSNVGERKELETIVDAMPVPGVRPSTNRSATKKRAEKFEDVISLEPTTIQSHIMRVVTDIAFRETIRSTASILLDQRIKDFLTDKLGEERAKMFGPWLRDIARLEAAEAEDVGGFVMKTLRYFRANVPIAVLGHALDNYMGDFTGLLTAVIGTDLKKTHYVAGLREFATKRGEARDFALSKSGELRSRSSGQETFADFSRRMKALTQTKVGRAEGVIKQHAFYFAEQIEKGIVTPVWLGAYRQALAENRPDDEAVKFADGIVRKAFPSKNVVDKAAIQRDRGVLGFTSMFVGYANWVFNQYRRIWNPVFQAEGTRDTTLAAASALMSHMALAIVVGPMAEFLVGKGPEKGEEPEDWFIRKLIIAHLMPLPLVGGFLEEKLFGKSASNRSNPGFAAIEAIGKAFESAIDEDGDGFDMLLATMKAYGYARGLPVLRLTRMLQYLLEGDYDNVGGIASGVLYGERRNGRQPANPIKLIDRALE